MRRVRPLVPRTLAVSAAVLLAATAAGAQPSPTIPPPTPVPPVGSPSPYPTELDTPAASTEPPSVAAASAALGDLDSGRLLFQQDATEPRPIASLTKIMTALLVLERTRPDELVVAGANATSQTGAELGLETGEQRTVQELLTAVLLQSANDAAVALAEHVSGSVEAFVDAMNRRARELRMRDTAFASPTGLDDSGVSTARDLARLASAAFLEPAFAELTSTKFARVPSDDGEARFLQNRNALLWLYDGSIGGKTGYTSAAGFCIVAAAERDGLRLAAVVLGASAQAFDEGATLLDHGFAAWERETVIELGERHPDPVVIGGREVDVEAGATLSVLAPRAEVLDEEVEPLPGVSLPVPEGEPVATLTVSAGGEPLGEVELLAAERVAAASRDGGSFWNGVWRALTLLSRRVYRALT